MPRWRHGWLLGTVATVAIASPALALDVSNDKATIRVTALTDSILRIRLAAGGRFAEDASWAVPANVRGQSVAVTSVANGFATKALQVAIDPTTLKLTVRDLAGHVLSSDADAPQMDGTAFTLTKAMPLGEQFHGLGDKTGPFDRRGASYVNWNTDAYGYSTSTDPLYKTIPFYVADGGPAGSYGLFLDSTWRSWFDFGHRRDDRLAIGADGGPIDYYVIAGPTTADVVRRFTDLTGKAPLPPRWAFGYQQSRYSYMSDAEVRTLAARLKAEHVPTDVIWLDIDFQDRNRPFTTNAKTFPDMKRLASDLGRDGIKLVAITDLHIAQAPDQGYAPYDSGIAGDRFVKNADGSLYVAPVWPGPAVFPDFSQATTRRWWGGLYRGFVDDGIAGFWNDMNEPAVFETPTKTMSLTTQHRVAEPGFAPRTATHAEMHNVYGMLNSRATFDGLTELRPSERPFVMTRATYAGGQRYAVTWTGDNSSTWDHLKLSVQQLLNLGLSGFPYAGADVGGFTGGPSPELLTRWFQIAAFTPIFRDHSANGTPRAEPWVDGADQLALRRRAVEERYRLLPYIYTVADEHVRTGDPLMRPVWYDYPAMAKAGCDQSVAFTLGHDILVAPSGQPESPRPYDVCLPKGCWYDLWSGLPAAASAAADGAPYDRREETPKLDRLPVFVRAGAIIPRQPLVQSSSQRPNGPLELHLYPGADCRGSLYDDDGKARAVERRAYLRQDLRCTVGADAIRLNFGARTGTFRPWWRAISVIVHGQAQTARVALGRKALKVTADPADQTLRFTLPDQPREAEVAILRR